MSTRQDLICVYSSISCDEAFVIAQYQTIAQLRTEKCCLSRQNRRKPMRRWTGSIYSHFWQNSEKKTLANDSAKETTFLRFCGPGFSPKSWLFHCSKGDTLFPYPPTFPDNNIGSWIKLQNSVNLVQKLEITQKSYFLPHAPTKVLIPHKNKNSVASLYFIQTSLPSHVWRN